MVISKHKGQLICNNYNILLATKIIATVRTVLLPSFKIERHAKFNSEVGNKNDNFSLFKFTNFPSILGVTGLQAKNPNSSRIAIYYENIYTYTFKLTDTFSKLSILCA